MSRRSKAEVLVKIVEVRDLQRRAAEMRVQEAANAVRRLDEARDEAARRMEQDLAAWSRSVGGATLGLMQARAWTQAIVADQADVTRVDGELAESKADRQRRSEAWRVAIDRFDTATDLSRAAERRLRQHREEALLNDMADRSARDARR